MLKVRAEKIPREEWGVLEELSHTICFGESRPADMNRYHFVMAGFIGKELMGYTTCMEMDAETVYLQHGGAFPNYEKSLYVWQAYQALLNALEPEYKRVWTRIKNTNTVMLKLALKLGFLIKGIYQFKGDTFVELEIEFLKEDAGD